MWLERHLHLIRRHDAVIIIAAPRMGVPRLISLLADEGPLVWIVLEEADKEYPLAQGNKLSDALKLTFGTRLFPRATPFQAGVATLKRYIDSLRPLTLAVSGVANGIDLAARLLPLRRSGCRVILSDDTLTNAEFERLLAAGGPDVLRLDEDDLRLTESEASAISGRRLSPTELHRQLEAAGYAFEPFLAAGGWQAAAGASVDLSEAVLPDSVEVVDSDVLDELLKAGQWRQAATFVVDHTPWRATDVLLDLTERFHEAGLHAELWRLLAQVSVKPHQAEDVLFWRLNTAARLGRVDEVSQEVEEHLAHFEAPELRALYAGVCGRDGDERRSEVERAYLAKETPFTAYQQGRALPDAADGAKLLKRAVRLAERRGREHEVSRNAAALTARLTDAGNYAQAARWGEWALSHFDRHELSDVQQRLYIVNNWAYSRLLIGESVGLELILEEAEHNLGDAFPGLRLQLRSTLGDYLLATERPTEALAYYRANYEEAKRNMKAIRGLSLVRALLETDRSETSEAWAVANEAFTLSDIDSWEYHRSAVLALGMASAFHDPAAATGHLKQVLETESASLADPQKVQAALYLSYSQLLLGDVLSAKATVGNFPNRLNGLSSTGLRLLSGPAMEFREVWNWCRRETPPLELRFLGSREVVLEGAPHALGVQPCSLLALLVSHPQGLTSVQLLSQLKLEGDNMRALYTAISKLRNLVPISLPPYRIEVEVYADFVEARGLLQEGRLRQALELYRGPLLEYCDAPGIADLRAALDETFRQAVLRSDDAEASFFLAKRTHDDLELWEHSMRTLIDNDPRALFARARASQLSRDY